IVWGGWYSNGSIQYLATGGRYDPFLDRWSPTSMGPNVPAARRAMSAVWTGAEMIVWGGENPTILNTGGRYDPSTDGWSPTSTGAGVPSARTYQTAVWTGTEMIVWGGSLATGDTSPPNSGGRYDPLTDQWAPTSMGANVPSPRPHGHSAVWTGAEM